MNEPTFNSAWMLVAYERSYCNECGVSFNEVEQQNDGDLEAAPVCVVCWPKCSYCCGDTPVREFGANMCEECFANCSECGAKPCECGA